MAADSDPRRRAAARVLAQGRNQATAAAAAGVARSTVMRWCATDDFKALVKEIYDEIQLEDNPLDLESLVPLAHEQLKQSLTGEGHISASQAKIALDVLKAAQQQEAAATNATGGTLAARLAELGEDVASD